VRGKGGHAAAPHNCIDPVLVASHIVTALQSSAVEDRGLRDHVEGVARLDLRDRDHRRFHRVDGAKGGHAAAPHNCIDPVLVASHIVTALQSIASRTVDLRSAAAMIAPGRIAKWPSGRPGMLCRP
jgi:metal-dependent amidase/aminoacylase/carboxypeptidase family protein